MEELVPDVLGTAAPDDENDDDGGSDPNSDCGRFAITETLKDLRKISGSCLFLSGSCST